MCSSSRRAWRSIRSHCESLHALPQHGCELCMRSGSTTFDGRDHLEPNSLANPDGPGTPHPNSSKPEVTCYQSPLPLGSGRRGSVESYLVEQDRSLQFNARAGCPSRLGPSLRRISDQKPTKARSFVLLVKLALKRSPGSLVSKHLAKQHPTCPRQSCLDRPRKLRECGVTMRNAFCSVCGQRHPGELGQSPTCDSVKQASTVLALMPTGRPSDKIESPRLLKSRLGVANATVKASHDPRNASSIGDLLPSNRSPIWSSTPAQPPQPATVWISDEGPTSHGSEHEARLPLAACRRPFSELAARCGRNRRV